MQIFPAEGYSLWEGHAAPTDYPSGITGRETRPIRGKHFHPPGKNENSL